MNETRLKYALGMTIVLSHIIIVIYTFFLFSISGFSFDQFTTMIAIILPMLAGVSTPIISFIIDDRHRRDVSGRRLTLSFVALSMLFPSVFFVCIFSAITLQALSLSFSSFDDFKAALVLIEGAFAIYAGRFVTTLYEQPPVNPPME